VSRTRRELARNLGVRFLEIPISEVFTAYLNTLTPFFEGRALDVAEENIQSRIRGNTLMALSNKLGYLVLTTGNKSELAVGYCTLYGDMSGGLAVIADVPKTMVYELARYVNREREIIPQACLTKPPSQSFVPTRPIRTPYRPTISSTGFSSSTSMMAVHWPRSLRGAMTRGPSGGCCAP